MKNLATLTITMASLLLITSTTVLYSEGWRLGIKSEKGTSKPVVIKTGMLAVRSIPDGAKVYLDGKLITATDDTIASLLPKDYNLKIEQQGFDTWEKTLTVYPELVTDITAVLILQSPRLEPLTNTDVKAYSLSSNQNNVAFLTKNHKEPGIWILPLTGSPLNMFKNGTRLLISDNAFASPSMGEKIWWSPDDKEILVQMNTSGYLLYELTNQNNTSLIPTSVTNVAEVFSRWEKSWRTNFLDRKLESITKEQELSGWLLEKVSVDKSTWSPDDEKFFITSQNKNNPNEYDIIVYNSETNLPVGERRVYDPIKILDPKNTVIQWYSDSYHLILLEKSPSSEFEHSYTVSLIRIDGTNRTPIYTGDLASNQAYPTPSGDKIIVLTSLKENSQTNLYAISIR